MNELREKLRIDDWLELIKEDKNLNNAYISIAKYVDILEQKLKRYEDPEDLLLISMYCEEKAKGKIKELQQENQQLKGQLEFEKRCQNRFFKVNNKSYDGRIVLEQLKQRDEVIDEAISTIAIIIRDFEENEVPLKINDLDNLLEILQQYKGDSK